jgi:hypothetical protein
MWLESKKMPPILRGYNSSVIVPLRMRFLLLVPGAEHCLTRGGQRMPSRNDMIKTLLESLLPYCACQLAMDLLHQALRQHVLSGGCEIVTERGIRLIWS